MPRLIDHDVRRRTIVRAAWGVIAEGGVAAATIRAVADAAGLVPGSVRFIFPTQELLIRAVAGDLASAVRSESAARGARYPRADMAASRLAAGLPLIPETLLLWRVEIALRLSAASSPSLTDCVDECRQARIIDCRGALDDLAGGRVPSSVVDLEVLRTLALLEGLSYQVAGGGNLTGDAEEARLILLQHLRGLDQQWRRSAR